MKNFVIVSTYPEQGSKNIGDQLITTCLKNLVSDLIPDAGFSVIWRADSWDNVKSTVLGADHVFFACLALRPNMHKNEYPYLGELVDAGIPFSVIAAGTDLPVDKDADIYAGFSDDSIRLLKKVNDRAAVFTTRGGVSQEFCLRIGLEKVIFSGDVAFYDQSLSEVKFEKGVECKKIVVSDPHRASCYIKPFKTLLDGLRDLFPEAEVVVAQHGVNKVIDDFCYENSIKTEKIYEDRYGGLKVYDEADLHVGFRVHAHVSALKRRKYSYLLEQDGRGCDYGSTLERKISVSNFIFPKNLAKNYKNLARLLLGRPLNYVALASVSPVHQLLAIIRHDSEDEFRKFAGLEDQILKFNRLNQGAIEKALGITESSGIV
ncbi:polysaccharide pyruvyl transferase family protein [Halomonas icarae]|uniref:Polysaccharide pyruvyl transferase domain-containing protein n=1 Tax=Halomonas icarae TaxID=2691040 RepID=A0A7X4VWH0_9GAMM|nr:polysaccharide pyruvyl transferase family protein [Halomonas icarae]MDR5903018.1 polysaccharide pyruvyl transferase family protein [Halomonas icarae]NAW11575.1 hypothetical protein [Halomonas icarae]